MTPRVSNNVTLEVATTDRCWDANQTELTIIEICSIIQRAQTNLHKLINDFLCKRNGTVTSQLQPGRGLEIQSMLPHRVRRFCADCALGGQYGLTIAPQKFPSLDASTNATATLTRFARGAF
jgi:hypothetical protein